jgi:hypothetical protein
VTGTNLPKCGYGKSLFWLFLQPQELACGPHGKNKRDLPYSFYHFYPNMMLFKHFGWHISIMLQN